MSLRLVHYPGHPRIEGESRQRLVISGNVQQIIARNPELTLQVAHSDAVNAANSVLDRASGHTMLHEIINDPAAAVYLIENNLGLLAATKDHSGRSALVAAVLANSAAAKRYLEVSGALDAQRKEQTGDTQVREIIGGRWPHLIREEGRLATITGISQARRKV